MILIRRPVLLLSRLLSDGRFIVRNGQFQELCRWT